MEGIEAVCKPNLPRQSFQLLLQYNAGKNRDGGLCRASEISRYLPSDFRLDDANAQPRCLLTIRLVVWRGNQCALAQNDPIAFLLLWTCK